MHPERRHAALLGPWASVITWWRRRAQAPVTVRPTVTIGSRTLDLQGVDLSQVISFSSSLRAAITDIINLTASGQIVVNAADVP